MPENDSALNRLAGAFLWPVSTFASIARRPSWVAPLAIWTVVSTAVGVSMRGRVDLTAVFRERMARGGQTLSEADLAKAAARAEPLMGVFSIAVGLLGPALISLLVAGIFWLAWIAFGSETRFAAFYGTTVHAFLPHALAAIFFVPLLLGAPRLDPREIPALLPSHLGALTDPLGRPVAFSLLQSIDVFSLWTLALLVIAYSAATGTRRRTTAAVVVGMWALFVAGRTGLAALRGA